MRLKRLSLMHFFTKLKEILHKFNLQFQKMVGVMSSAHGRSRGRKSIDLRREKDLSL